MKNNHYNSGDFIEPNKIVKSKSYELNRILEELLSSVEIQAVIIADWQGLAMASKLPQENLDKEDLIAATTLFSLTGAEDTRKELQDTLLGKKLSYLLMMTEEGKYGTTPFMVVCPIEDLGYIACISNKREDMAIMIMNMKRAAEKAADVLLPHKREEIHELEKYETAIRSVQAYKDSVCEDSQYNKILNKIRNLKNIKVSSFVPPSGLKKEAPTPAGRPPIPKPPQAAPEPMSVESKFKSIAIDQATPTEISSTPIPPYPQAAQPSTDQNKIYTEFSIPPKPQAIPQDQSPEYQQKTPQVISYKKQQPVQQPEPQSISSQYTSYPKPLDVPSPIGFKKFLIKFQNEKEILFTMVISAPTIEDAIRICQEKNPQFKIVKIIEAHELNP
ncbi:MAG: hypothetical protein ACTSRP_10395 [Candidatus Helarchaeota archaeon]